MKLAEVHSKYKIYQSKLVSIEEARRNEKKYERKVKNQYYIADYWKINTYTDNKDYENTFVISQ